MSQKLKLPIVRRYTFAVVLIVVALLSGNARGPLALSETPAKVATGSLEETATDERLDALSLDTSPLFGVASTTEVNEAGDFAFLGTGSTAMFFRPAGGIIRRVAQVGDPVPGVPQSRTDIVGSPRLNNTGRLAFVSQLNTPNGISQAAIVVYDGVNLQKIAASADIAPGTGGAIYGRTIVFGGLNNAGDIAFTGSLLPFNSGVSSQQNTTLFIVPNGGAAQRIAGPGDSAPGTGGGTLTSIAFVSGTSSLNNAGEVIFRAQITGGNGGFGLFAGSLLGVRKIVAHGDSMPGGGNFSFPTSAPTAFLNNFGQCAFTNGTYWIQNSEGGITKLVASGDNAPAALGGTLTLTSMLALNDSGVLAFTANVNASGVTPRGLFRFVPGSGVETVAFANQPAAGAAPGTLSAFSGVSINQTGQVSFLAGLVGGSIPRGIYQQSGAGNPVQVVLEGQTSTVPGGGNYFLVNSTFTRTLDNGSTYFWSDLLGGAADYAEFVGTSGSLTNLMNNGEALPAGSRLTLRNFSIQSSGDYVAFSAQQAGGRFSIIVRNVVTNVTTTVGMAGDVAPGTGGARFRATGGFFVNSSGSVAFNANTIGGTQVLANGVFLWTTAGGISKVVHHGDIEPISSAPFLFPTISTFAPSQLNNSNRVAFRATVLSRQGIYLSTPGGPTVRVVQNADAAPGGGTFASFSISLAINQSGQVAFFATTTGGPGSNQGIFVGTPGGGVAKVAVSGDAVPGGGTFFTFPNTVSFNDSGEVGFIASLGPAGATGVVCFGTTAGPLEVLARDGLASPAGGTFLMTGTAVDILVNNQHDVVFRSALAGGGADSAYFLRRGAAGQLQVVAMQGQGAPGTSGPFMTIQRSLNSFLGEFFALGPTGEVAFNTQFQSVAGAVTGVFRYRTDNLLEKVIVRGDIAPGTGNGVLLASSQAVGAGGPGRFAFWEWIFGGDVDDVIFVTSAPAGFSITGQVKDVNGIPIPGVGVILSGSVSGTTTTDATGNYSFLNLTNGGNYSVTPSIPTFAFSPASQTFNSLAANRIANFGGTQTIVAISGNVVDNSNAPINSVTLSLTKNGVAAGTVQTNALGNYSFPNLAAGSNYVVTPVGSFIPSSQTFGTLTTNGVANFKAAPNIPSQCNVTTFSSPNSHAVGSVPRSVAHGDFNADGKLDMAVANTANNNVSVLLGDGLGGFAGPTNFAAGTDPLYVAVGEFNGDGDLDLAVANNGGANVSILLGAAGGTFGAPTNFGAGTAPYTLAIGDFNGDGRSDIAVANNGGNVSVLLGTGSGSFGGATNFAVAANPTGSVVADFNGDGNLDIAIANSSANSVSVLLGTGTGSFGPANILTGGTDPRSISAADLNGDGKVDLAVGNNVPGTVSILIGTGTGTFGAPTPFTVGTSPLFVGIADFNGDNKLDVAAANFNSANVSVLLGTGTGSFNAAMNFAAGTSPRSLGVADVNADGKPDLSVVTLGTNSVSVLLNTSTSCSALASLTISGQVKSAVGGPLADVAITLSGPITRVVTSDVNGNYTFPNLAPGGNYAVTVQSNYFVFGPSRADLFNLSSNQTVNFNAAPNVVPLPTPTPSDNFNTPTRDPERWNLGTQTQPVGAVDPLVTTTQVNGQLVIKPVAQAVGLHYNGYVSANSFDFRNGVASVELVQAASGGADSIFAIGSDLNNFTRFVVHTAGGPSGVVNMVRDAYGKLQPLDNSTAQLVFQVRINGDLTSVSIPYDQQLHRYLRFRHEAQANAILFETSGNNVDYTERHRVSLTKSVSALTAELSAGTPNPTNPGQTIFNDFSLVTSTYQFSAANYAVGEGEGSIVITVTRQGTPGVSGTTATVEYSTVDGTAQQKSRYIPAVGTLTFAPGQMSRTFTVLVVDNVLTEGNQTVNLVLGNALGSALNTPGRAVLTIVDNDTLATAVNPVDDAVFYAKQHYLDFFSREADASGQAFWANEITSCGSDVQCREVKRINVSAAFFLSIEFQQTGYLVERIYKVAYGDGGGSSTFGGQHQLAVPIIRREEFLPDTQEIGLGVVVGSANWEQHLESNKMAFVNGFVQRTRFANAYANTLTPAQYVDMLFQHAGVTPTAGERTTAINEFAGAQTSAEVGARARALRQVAEHATLKTQEFNRAFVLMQYFGYLRRNPNGAPDADYTGYDFWLTKLNQFGGNFVNAEMVKAFTLSDEYRRRFGP